jgi:malonyl-CoA/methylmalonyl-CoA synthetase
VVGEENLIPLLQNAARFRERTAIATPERRYSYDDLLQASGAAATGLLSDNADLDEQRVAFLVSPGFDYVAALWGIWCAGGLAVPLCPLHPAPELAYVIDDCDAAFIVSDAAHAGVLRPLAQERGLPLFLIEDLQKEVAQTLPDIAEERRALMLYTSGTTGKPKGVVSLHSTLEAQTYALRTAWEWTENDAIYNVLPLHHIHGIVNVLCCALRSGARWETAQRFDAEGVLRRLSESDLTLFMAVPTVYARLIAAYENASDDERQAFRDGCRKLRLMVSGSAALPVPTLEKWREISGHVLLERYGMTETGMILSNPLHGERRAGSVGVPLPGVQVRLATDHGIPSTAGTSGEIQVKGASVFREYWRRPEATAQAFTEDGWFRTGDIAIEEAGAYRIQGRASTDIIKTGGYKVSALEIEEVLREHPAIAECAVVGVPDEEWGQQVAAVVELREGAQLELAGLRSWAKERLAAYKAPARLLVVEALPRNALGKTDKPKLLAFFSISEPAFHCFRTRKK